MAKLISISVNVDKIDKTRLVKGEKGNYLNLTIALNDEQGKFGNDVSCWQGQTKEEREAKAQKNYLGNGKTIWSGGSSAPQSSNDRDDLPF